MNMHGHVVAARHAVSSSSSSSSSSSKDKQAPEFVLTRHDGVYKEVTLPQERLVEQARVAETEIHSLFDFRKEAMTKLQAWRVLRE